MKIALLASTFLPRIGGAEIVVHNLARQFRARGHDARVITWWGQWKGIRGKVDYPVIPLLPHSYSNRSRRRWEEGKGSTAVVGAQVALIQRIFDFDVWNVHMAHPIGMLAVPTLHRIGVPVVTTCHGDDIFILPECGYRILENKPIRDAVTCSLLLSCGVTAISQSVRERYVEMGVPPERINDVPNGVDFERIHALPADRAEIRARYGLSLEHPLILTVGRHHKQKGYEQIPVMAEHLKEHGLDFTWVILGAGAPAFVHALQGGEAAAHMRGFEQIAGGQNYDEMPPNALIEIMKAADVMVFPSKFETFGLVLVEAMAAGLPVCTTDAPGCKDVVEHGRNGMRAAVGDPFMMADHIRQVLQNRSLRRSLIAEGTEYARRLSWEKVATQYTGLYRQYVRDARAEQAI